MKTVLFEPHLDDAVLFACYTLISRAPVVATCLGKTVTGQKRLNEHAAAMRVLGLRSRQGQYPESNPDWDAVRQWIELVVDEEAPDLIYGPMEEDGGHEQHNEIARLIDGVALGRGIDTIWYMTYRRGDRRSRGNTEIQASEGYAALKLRAMACYESQVEWIHTRPWFAADDALREWYA